MARRGARCRAAALRCGLAPDRVVHVVAHRTAAAQGLLCTKGMEARAALIGALALQLIHRPRRN
eukprot:2848427-Pleurochrysis_carterae.AAC.2